MFENIHKNFLLAVLAGVLCLRHVLATEEMQPIGIPFGPFEPGTRPTECDTAGENCCTFSGDSRQVCVNTDEAGDRLECQIGRVVREGVVVAGDFLCVICGTEGKTPCGSDTINSLANEDATPCDDGLELCDDLCQTPEFCAAAEFGCGGLGHIPCRTGDPCLPGLTVKGEVFDIRCRRDRSSPVEFVFNPRNRGCGGFRYSACQATGCREGLFPISNFCDLEIP